MNDETSKDEEQENEGQGNWWKDFFTLLSFTALIIIIISLIIYGIFFRSKKEETPPSPQKEYSSPSNSKPADSKGFFSSVFSYFKKKSSSNETKSEDKQLNDNETAENTSDSNSENKSKLEEIPEVKKELLVYWSESNQKIVQLEQTINDVVAIVIKTFPPPIQRPKNTEILSTPSASASNNSTDESSGKPPVLETIKSRDFNGSWTEVGKELIKLEEEQEKIIKLLKSE